MSTLHVSAFALVSPFCAGLALLSGCGSDVNLVDPATTSGAGGAGGAGSTSSEVSATSSSATTSSTTGSGGGSYCPGLVVSGENGLLVTGTSNPIALLEGSADGQTSVLAYSDGGALRLLTFAPWNQWPEVLPPAQAALSAQGGFSFGLSGAPSGLLGGVFLEPAPGGSDLVVAPTIDPFAPGSAERFPIPIGQRALCASAREDETGRQVLVAFEEQLVDPSGATSFSTRHAVSTPPNGFTIGDTDGCSFGLEWASAFPVEAGFRLVTLGAPTSDGCPSAGYATAIRAIQLYTSGETGVLSYLDRGFPIDQAALAPNDEGALIVHTAIMNTLTPIWLIDWHEASGTFGEPVILSAPQFQGWGPLAAARVGPVTAVAYVEMPDPSTGRPRLGLDIVSDKKSTAHLDIEASSSIDNLALLGSPYGTALVVAYSTSDGEVRVLKVDCVGAL